MKALKHPRPLGLATAAAMLAVAIGLVWAQSGVARTTTHHPRGGFVRRITNPYLPYRVGSRWIYRGVKDGVSQRDLVVVTPRTRRIMGVNCTAVRDVASHGKTILESTTDWYAQDRAGNVWYFGEATKAYSGGTVDTSGSWIAGVRGAQPGIVMTAHPRVGDTHRQEYWRGQAEDQYWLVDLGQRVRVPSGSFSHAALTLEWSRLEPNVIDRKDYVRGIGVVKELAAEGPREVANLVAFSRSGR